MATKKVNLSGHKIKLRIALTDSGSFRTIVVPGDTPLLLLHEMIQILFGWMGYHLHQFEKGKAWYQLPVEEEELFGVKVKDETKYNLSHLIAKVGDTFGYTYDFGDNREHEIVVEDVNATEEPYTCTEVHGLNAVEDSMYFGCTKGIETILLNKKDKQYKELVGWLKEAFNLSPKDVLEIPAKEALTDELTDLGSEYLKFGLERFLD
jgi:hypothetical protein